MNRRDAVVALLAMGATPFTVHAQHAAKIPRIGILSSFSPSDTSLWHKAFRQGLLELGWVEGKNVGIESYASARVRRPPRPPCATNGAGAPLATMPADTTASR